MVVVETVVVVPAFVVEVVIPSPVDVDDEPGVVDVDESDDVVVDPALPEVVVPEPDVVVAPLPSGVEVAWSLVLVVLLESPPSPPSASFLIAPSYPSEGYGVLFSPP